MGVVRSFKSRGHHLAFLDRFRWRTHADAPGRQILEHAGAGADDSTRPNLDTGADENIRREPNVVPDFNGRPQKRELDFGIIVRPGTKMPPLADRHALPDGDRPQTVEDYVI